MNQPKRARIEKALREADERRNKALTSLAHCLGRSDVMRIHHDALVQELLDAGGIERFTDVKKQRFAAYVCFWFAGLATVIERYQELVARGTLPASQRLTDVLTIEFIDLVKPFRNAVAHCSPHDDERVLELLSNPHTVPDRAAQVAHAFHEYIEQHQRQNARQPHSEL